MTRKLDEGDQFVDDVGRLLFDMIVMSFTFENDIAPSRGIGKVFDDVSVHVHDLFGTVNFPNILISIGFEPQ